MPLFGTVVAAFLSTTQRSGWNRAAWERGKTKTVRDVPSSHPHSCALALLGAFTSDALPQGENKRNNCLDQTLVMSY